MINDFIAQWHQAVSQKDDSVLSNLLSDEVTFYSPVVYTPQQGKMITFFYLKAASEVLANEHFRYTHTTVGDDRIIFEFETELDGVYVNGVDIIDLDEHGKMKAMKVMVRPLQAMNKLHALMGEMMESMKE